MFALSFILPMIYCAIKQTENDNITNNPNTDSIPLQDQLEPGLSCFDQITADLTSYLQNFDIFVNPELKVNVLVILKCVEHNDTILLEYNCKDFGNKIVNSHFLQFGSIKFHEFYMNNNTPTCIDTVGGCMYEQMHPFKYKNTTFTIAIGFFEKEFYTQRKNIDFNNMVINSLYNSKYVCKMLDIFHYYNDQGISSTYTTEKVFNCYHNNYKQENNIVQKKDDSNDKNSTSNVTDATKI